MLKIQARSAFRAAAMSGAIALFIGCASSVVKCPECEGDGKVYYGPDHPIVKMGFDVGEYECPMCGGSGELEDGK